MGIGLCGQIDREIGVESVIVNTAHTCTEIFILLSTNIGKKLQEHSNLDLPYGQELTKAQVTIKKLMA